MKQRAAVYQSLSMALAAAVVGAACLAGPAAADQTEPAALAPLPEVSAPVRLFAQGGFKFEPAKGGKADAPDAKLEVPGKDGKDEKYDGDGHEDECYDWDDLGVKLRDLPVGYVLDEGWSSNLIPNHPAGFPSDEYSYYMLVLPLGGGTEISFGGVTAEALRRPGQAVFYGGGLQKRLINEGEGSMMPAVSVGVRGNVGPDSHDTLGGYLVGTKRISGGECGKSGVFLTGGMRAEGYDTDRNLAVQRTRLHVLRDQDGSGLRPFGGLVIALSPAVQFSAEVSKAMPWEFNNPFCVRGRFLVKNAIGLDAGIRNVGYITHGFVGIAVGDLNEILGAFRGRDDD